MVETRHENELLICSARKSLDDTSVERLRTLVRCNLDWDYVLDSADRHGMMPLLYHHLSNTVPEDAPHNILESLKARFTANQGWSLFLTGELLRLLELFAAHGVAAVGFKGPILSFSSYGDLTLRQARDVDILIEKKSAFQKAKTLLRGEGYKMEPDLTPSQQSAHLRFHCEIQFINPVTDFIVDLHWGLAPKTFTFMLAPEDLFKRLQTISFGESTVRTFSNEDLLLYLCAHGAKHLWHRLEWIASVAELARVRDIDWNVVAQLASNSSSQRMLRLGLVLARKLQKFELPADLEESIQRDHGLKEFAEQIWRETFSNNTEAEIQIRILRFNLQIMDSKSDAVFCFLRSTVIPTIADWNLVTLSAGLYPLYYVLRPIRLVGKHSYRLYQRLVSGRKRSPAEPTNS